MKKNLAILLGAALLLGLLAGCGGAGQTPAEETAASQASESASTAPATASEAPPVSESPASEPPASPDQATAEPAPSEAPAYAKVGYPLPLYDEQKSYTMFYAVRGGGGNSFPSRDDPGFTFWVRLQENLNVDLKFTEPGDTVATEQFNLMVASGDMTDIICENMVSMEGSAYTGGYDKAIADGIYVNLMDYIEYAPNYAYYALGDEGNRKVVVTDEGNIGAFLNIKSEDEKANMGLSVNAQYLKDTGLDMPSTVNEWLEVYEAMKNNGVQFPTDVNSSGAIMNGQFMNATGASLTTGFLLDAETLDFVFGPTTDETRQYIELFIDCAEKGWIDPDWTTPAGIENPKFNQGLIATKDIMGQMIATYKDRYGIELEACPIVHREGYGPGQRAIVSQVTSRTGAGGGMVVSTNCKDIEGAMKLLDWPYSDEGADICNFGWTEGETYEVKDGQKFINDFYQARSDYGFGNKSLYTSDGDFGLSYPNLSYNVAGEVQKNASDIWTADTSTDSAIYFSLPSAVRLTSGESEALSSQLADLETYIESTTFRWMCLEDELTDESWNEFVSTCQSMNLGEIQAAYEAAYQRYQEK